ncbi:hypothetical protein C1S80_29060 [Mycolicibacterium aubagnense]|nr:hypothetical protein C1S80_29060 [Mycolicibacterium aubagnense]
MPSPFWGLAGGITGACGAVAIFELNSTTVGPYSLWNLVILAIAEATPDVASPRAQAWCVAAIAGCPTGGVDSISRSAEFMTLSCPALTSRYTPATEVYVSDRALYHPPARATMLAYSRLAWKAASKPTDLALYWRCMLALINSREACWSSSPRAL